MTLTIVSTGMFGDASMHRFRAAAPDIEVYQFPRAQSSEIPLDILARADVYYALTDFPAPEAAPNLKWVQINWAGADRALRMPLFASGTVQLTTGAGIHAVNMGEYTLMMMLALAHRMPIAHKMMNEGRWPREGTWARGKDSAFMPMELRGATLGLIGYGWIGKEIARLAGVFGMQVLAMRRSLHLSAGESVGEGEPNVTFIKRIDLSALLTQSDFVVLVVPSTPQTRGMIGATELAQMKPGAYLINIGRGDAVDETALCAALQNGQIAGAALDVFQQEPLPDDSPLWALANAGKAILTPHIAGQTPHYEQRAADLFAENLRRYVAGETLLNRVDFTRGY
jgi:phosphoglycerate dehydrogenase-like enzyme